MSFVQFAWIGPMRLLVISIALLAGLKVWTQDRLYRAAMNEALIAAYRERAVQSCYRSVARLEKTGVNPWSSARSADVVIGDGATGVAIWDFDNPMWDVRFRHPHLVLTTTGAQPNSCAFDLIAGLATVRAR